MSNSVAQGDAIRPNVRDAPNSRHWALLAEAAMREVGRTAGETAFEGRCAPASDRCRGPLPDCGVGEGRLLGSLQSGKRADPNVTATTPPISGEHWGPSTMGHQLYLPRISGFIRTHRRPPTKEEVVPQVGLEPTRPCGQQILSLPRLPFRHWGPAREGRGYKARASGWGVQLTLTDTSMPPAVRAPARCALRAAVHLC